MIHNKLTIDQSTIITKIENIEKDIQGINQNLKLISIKLKNESSYEPKYNSNKVKKEIQNFFTINRYSRALQSKKKIIKCLWLIFCALSIFLYLFFVINNLLSFFEYNFFTEIKTVDKDMLTFPAVTFCLINREDYLKQNQEFEEVFLNCKYSKEETCQLNEFQEVQIFVDKNNSLTCYKYNGGVDSKGNSIRIKNADKPGKFSGLKLILYLPESASILYYIGDTKVLPIQEELKQIHPGYVYESAVEKKVDEKLPYPFNDCIKEKIITSSEESSLLNQIIKQNQTYRRKNCLNLCGDVLAICSPLCPLECESIDYDLSDNFIDIKIVRKGDINKFHDELKIKLKDPNITVEDVRKGLSIIHVYYDRLSYIHIVQVEKTSLTDIISNIGGLSGLFLEISLFSVFRLVQFIIEISF